MLELKNASQIENTISVFFSRFDPADERIKNWKVSQKKISRSKQAETKDGKDKRGY